MDSRLKAFPPAVDLTRPGFGIGGRDHADNRWTPARKESVVQAVRNGQIPLCQAERDYALSFDEFLSWASAYAAGGQPALRAVKGLVSTRPGTNYRVPYTEGRRHG